MPHPLIYRPAAAAPRIAELTQPTLLVRQMLAINRTHAHTNLKRTTNITINHSDSRLIDRPARMVPHVCKINWLPIFQGYLKNLFAWEKNCAERVHQLSFKLNFDEGFYFVFNLRRQQRDLFYSKQQFDGGGGAQTTVIVYCCQLSYR